MIPSLYRYLPVSPHEFWHHHLPIFILVIRMCNCDTTLYNFNYEIYCDKIYFCLSFWHIPFNCSSWTIPQSCNVIAPFSKLAASWWKNMLSCKVLTKMCIIIILCILILSYSWMVYCFQWLCCTCKNLKVYLNCSHKVIS